MSSKQADIYRELQSCIQDDKMYWLKNDAKLRAVVTSKSYDEFKDYVAAAHLSPITRKEMTEKKPVNWNKSMR
uniref:Coiled-coil domain-containing protein 103 n=1 Tax=Diabrotica virgifera virgifera TaxID=50390 RepID=A0A6P7FZ71_DIAVI